MWRRKKFGWKRLRRLVRCDKNYTYGRYEQWLQSLILILCRMSSSVTWLDPFANVRSIIEEGWPLIMHNVSIQSIWLYRLRPSWWALDVPQPLTSYKNMVLPVGGDAYYGIFSRTRSRVMSSFTRFGQRRTSRSKSRQRLFSPTSHGETRTAWSMPDDLLCRGCIMLQQKHVMTRHYSSSSPSWRQHGIRWLTNIYL